MAVHREDGVAVELEGFADAVAVDVGEHEVEEDEARLVEAHPLDRLLALGHDGGVVAAVDTQRPAFGQALAQLAGHIGLDRFVPIFGALHQQGHLVVQFHPGLRD